MTKQDVINTYIELFTRGEMLKGENFINNCIPLEFQEDKDILRLRKECNERMAELRGWENGRPYPGTHAIVDFNSFPKFVLARDIILSKNQGKRILDIGCYSGVFLESMSREGFDCWGIDIHKELVDKLNEESVNEPFYQFGSAEKIPMIDAECDIITAFDVLEHVFDIDKAISEIDRVLKPGGLAIINIPRMTPGYKDEAFEHLRMFSENDVLKIWGNKKEFKMYDCKDELGRKTWFFTYTK